MDVNFEVVRDGFDEVDRSFSIPVTGLTVRELRDHLKGARENDIVYVDIGSIAAAPELEIDEYHERIVTLQEGALEYVPGSGLIKIISGSETITKILNQVPNNIFRTLVEHVNHPLSREELRGCLSRTYNGSSLKTVDNHIRVIRESLGEHEGCITTIKGLGYMYRDI